jgi:mannosyltransferase
MTERTATVLAMLACLAAMLLSRVPFLDDSALWIDEAFSLYHARHSFSQLWGIGWQLESSPPLYYTAIWAWTHLFGDAEPVARSLSLLLTVLAAFCVYGAGAVLGGARAGAVAAVLFLCQPLMFVYSLEIRPYALQVLLIAAAVAAFARALSDFESGRTRTAAGALRGLAPVVAAAALATYTHSTTPTFLAALSGAGAVYGIIRRSSRGYWAAWFLAGCATLVAIVPELLVMLNVIQTNERGIAWIPFPDLRFGIGVARSLAVGEHSWNTGLTKLVGGGAIGLIAWSGWRLRKHPLALTVGLVLPAFGFALLWAVSMTRPVMMPRTALWAVVPLCVFVGCGLSTLRWKGMRFWLLIGVIAVTLALMSATNLDNRTEDRPWPGIFTQLAREIQAGDEIVAVDKEVLCVLDYYTTGETLRGARRWRLERGPEQSYRSHQRIPLGCNESESITVEQISGRLARGTASWLLAGDDLQRNDIERVLQELGASVQVTRRHEWRGRTMAWRIAPSQAR